MTGAHLRVTIALKPGEVWGTSTYQERPESH